MKRCCEILTFVLLLWSIRSIHGEYDFGQEYSSAIVRPSKHYRSSPFDMISEESAVSRRKPERHNSPKRSQYSSSSEEDNNSRYVSDDNDDSREFTIGTQIRVTHPATQVKKSRHNLPFDDRTVSYSNINLSSDQKRQPKKKKSSSKYSELYRADPLEEVAPPQSAELLSYDRQNYSPRQASGHESLYSSVASRNQIEKYLEDQQKLLDEAIKLQLLNDPSPLAIGKYHQFLKSKDDERIEKEFEQELQKNKQLLKFKQNINSNSNNNNRGRRPRQEQGRRPNKPPVHPKTGVRHFRSPRLPGGKIVITV